MKLFNKFFKKLFNKHLSNSWTFLFLFLFAAPLYAQTQIDPTTQIQGLNAPFSCPYNGGANTLNYDPQNTEGQGVFQCNPDSPLLAIIKNPGVSNENIFQPNTANDPIFTANLPAAYNVNVFTINDSTNTPRMYLDKNFVLWADSFRTLDNNPTNQMSCESIPSGQAPLDQNGHNTLLYACDVSTNLPFFLDVNGVVTEPIGAATPKTLTHTTFDTAGTSNVFKINGQSITSTSGAFSKLMSAGTLSGTSALLCTDSSSGTSATTSSCPFFPSETTNSQTNLAVTSTGTQLVTILTPAAAGMYRVGVVATVVTAGVGCSPNGTFSAKITWQDGYGNIQGFDGATFNGVALGNGGASSAEILIYANAGQPIQGGLHVTTAVSGCSTNPLISTQMEALP